jgi:predicted hydrolase (HD superfamily)
VDRTEALAAIRARVQNENLIKHMLATEAIMRSLARRFQQNEDEWGLVGLIHDVDVELTDKEPQNHSI